MAYALDEVSPIREAGRGVVRWVEGNLRVWGGSRRRDGDAVARARARIVEVWEKSIVESLTYRGLERRWVEPGGKVIIGSWRTRLFTEDEWVAMFPPTGRDWPEEPPCPTRLAPDPSAPRRAGTPPTP